jgi:hypothetical protein
MFTHDVRERLRGGRGPLRPRGRPEEFVHARDRTEPNVADRVALPLEHGEAFID